jgi:hypothetical protein
MEDYVIDAAGDAATRAITNLRSALSEADPVQALLILPLIKRAVRLQQETEALRSAVDSAEAAE